MIDTFVMDNFDTKKEDVGRTYQGVDGYCPIAGYLGNEGWNVGLELRAKVKGARLELIFAMIPHAPPPPRPS
jgi:hypothetical protein